MDHESFSTDFRIDGSSRLALLADGHTDFLGCFARGWDALNTRSLRQLLLQEEPECESGRSLIYVCPECEDIGCGADRCKVTKQDQCHILSVFAYENGYEEPKTIDGVGPFEFRAEEYEALLQAAYEL